VLIELIAELVVTGFVIMIVLSVGSWQMFVTDLMPPVCLILVAMLG